VTLTKAQLRLLVAYVAAWHACGRTPRRLELRGIARISDPDPHELVGLGLLHEKGHRPTERAFAMLEELGVQRVRPVSRSDGYARGRIGETTTTD